jgi:ferritin-like metal-binding protein YciE
VRLCDSEGIPKEARIEMADLNERDSKLVQYLSEAYGKERELETALQAHIGMTSKGDYKKRLQQHLKETKAHAKALDRRIRSLGGGPQVVQTVVGKATAVAKGPLHAIRGDGELEKMLKNAKTEYFNEAEEIANYLSLENLAQKLGDSETAKLARAIRREEERMAKFLERQIKSLAGAVAVDGVPAAQRRGARPAPRKAAAKGPAAKRTAAARKPAARKRTAATRKPAARKKAGGAKASSRKKAGAKSS